MRFSFSLLSSGSAGNVGLLSYQDDTGERFDALLDAGLPWRACSARLGGVVPRALFLTHEHSDHARYAAEIARQFSIPVYATEGTARAAKLRGVELRLFAAGKIAHCGPFELRPFATPHDAEEPIGLVISAAGGCLGWVTDLGEVWPSVEAALAPCDAAVIEFNYDLDMLRRGRYPWPVKQRIAGPLGHLSNEQGAALLGALAARGRLRHVVLAHLSENNNLPELALGAARRQLQGRPISLHVASPKGVTEPLRVVGPSTQLSLF